MGNIQFSKNFIWFVFKQLIVNAVVTLGMAFNNQVD